MKDDIPLLCLYLHFGRLLLKKVLAPHAMEQLRAEILGTEKNSFQKLSRSMLGSCRGPHHAPI